ncbi:MAG: TlpA disulfide reductase family protein [Sporolactobacillus sp.]
MKKILALPNLDTATHWINKKLTAEYLSGKPLLIHFWSVSCSHCKEAMPALQALRDSYTDKIRVIAIHMPLSAADLDVNQVAAACQTYHIIEPVLIDNQHHLADAFSNRYVPAYYLFNQQHRLEEYHMGQRGVDRIGRALERLLQQM